MLSAFGKLVKQKRKALTSVNPYTEEELPQLRIQDVTHPEDLPANRVQFLALVAGGPDFQVEKRYLRKHGSEVWVCNQVNAIRDVQGTSFG